MEIWEQHDVLFHYTTSAGLAGILESQALHATHYKYMNDTTEIIHLAPKLKELTKPSVAKAIGEWAKRDQRLSRFVESQGGLEKVIEAEVGKMIDALYSVTFGFNRKNKFLQPYLLCFCHHNKDTYERDNGLLSQWRAYGRDAGYAIAFDVKNLVDMLKREAEKHFIGYGGIGDVVYDDNLASFNNEFADLIRIVGEQFPKMAVGQIPDLQPLYAPFESCVSRYKHQAFKEEREVRLCFSPLAKSLTDPQSPGYVNKEEKKVRFKNGFTPYITLFEEHNEPLPITRIIVGPHLEKEARREKLLRYLEITGLKIDAVCSRTPLI